METKVELSIDDRDSMVAIANDGSFCQSRAQRWAGIRCTAGGLRGKLYWEAEVFV